MFAFVNLFKIKELIYKKNKTSFRDKRSTFPGLEHIPDSNFYHYSFQLNIYKFILQTEYGMIIDYMLEHLASTMTGHNKRQNAHFYIGVGANGKSALLELMKFVLGDYYDDVRLLIINQYLQIIQ